jgi:hypothetical protein
VATQGGPVLDGSEVGACFLDRVLCVARGGARLRLACGNFPQHRISQTGVNPRSDQSGQHCIAGKDIQRPFAGSVVQPELGSVVQVAVSLPLSETAAHLLWINHEEPVRQSLTRETSEQVHSRAWSMDHRRTRAAELLVKSSRTGNHTYCRRQLLRWLLRETLDISKVIIAIVKYLQV